MKKTVLITGASMGIGAALAEEFAKHRVDLVLTARNKKKLEIIAADLNTRYRVTTHYIPADLSLPGAADDLYKKIKEKNLEINYLVNNAGFGDFGLFADSDWKRQEEMINLNVLALTRLCRLFIPDMKGQKHGRIMNLASTAAFVPGPLMSVYYATKAFVLSFSVAIREELKKDGISVTALCPGATKSNFEKNANLQNSGLFKKKSNLPTSEEVARFGYHAMMKGTSVAIPGIGNKLNAFGSHLVTRATLAKVVRMISEER